MTDANLETKIIRFFDEAARPTTESQLAKTLGIRCCDDLSKTLKDMHAAKLLVKDREFYRLSEHGHRAAFLRAAVSLDEIFRKKVKESFVCFNLC